MDPLLSALETTLRLALRLGTIMFLSLFGVELLMQLGLMRHLRPLGKPVARLAHLPSESALSFLTAIGSMVAAHTMTARFQRDNRLTMAEVHLTGVLNTVPFHFKETLTFQLPVVLPLLGWELCLIYITAFWLTGVLKLLFVVGWGRWCLPIPRSGRDAFDDVTCDPAEKECTPRSWRQVLQDTWDARRGMYLRMISLLTGVTLVIQLLIELGLMRAFERLIGPMTDLLHLPAAVIGPISAYVFSPTVGITYMGNILAAQQVTPGQAIVALLAGGLVMIPVSRLRRTLPRYIAIYGAKPGAVICALTTGLSMTARALLLLAALVYY
ncbi:MAG: hypothetical protein QNJ22_05895 [Desulfosarcinaceae bacterium]|nr:hypothetical protein [Desulfosarcinaceae bacterium]